MGSASNSLQGESGSGDNGTLNITTANEFGERTASQSHDVRCRIISTGKAADKGSEGVTERFWMNLMMPHKAINSVNDTVYSSVSTPRLQEHFPSESKFGIQQAIYYNLHPHSSKA